jgi:RimJ/RimL family protein N-acetyltransferase
MTPDLAFPVGRLTPFTEAHLGETYVSWLNDPAVTRFSELRHSRHDLDECRDYFLSMQGSGNHFWAVHASALNDAHVGNITAYLDKANGTANLAIMIGDPRARGMGIGRAAWIAAVEWLLGDGGIRKVYAGTMAVNRPMLGLFQAAKMEIEGRFQSHFLLDGTEVDLIQAARFRRAPPVQVDEAPGLQDRSGS